MEKEPWVVLVSSLAFLLCYLAAHFGVLVLAQAMNEATLLQSWRILGEDADSARHVVMYAPIATPFFGSITAAMLIQNTLKLGSERVGGRKFFLTGWIAFVVANMAIIVLALNLFVNRELGDLWVNYLGPLRFNIWVFVLDPTLGFVAGALGVFLTASLIEAQQS